MFRKKEAARDNPVSPRAVIRPPPLSFDGPDPTARLRTDTGFSSRARTDTGLSGREISSLDDLPPASPKTNGAKTVLRPPEIQTAVEDTTKTQLVVGKKAMLRPVLSPVEKPKPDFFSRLSFRKLQPINPPQQPEEESRSPKPFSPTTGEPPSPPKVPEFSNELEVIARISERRGWGKTFPTNNPHCMHALLKEAHPFKKVRNMSHTTALELAYSLEQTIYCSPRPLGLAAKQRFQRGDVVVVGCPRSGQTPILQILQSLKTKSYVPAHALVDTVSWVEGPFKPQVLIPGRRIFKTHMPIQSALKGEHGKIAEHKIVIVLRDPVDTRLSWYRHIRRLIKKCHRVSIDQNLEIGSFTYTSFPVPLLPKQQEQEVIGKEPEYEISWALRAALEYPECVQLIFYEELFSDPCAVVEKLARFTGGMDPEMDIKRAAASSTDVVDEKEEARLAEIRRREEAELVVSITNALISDASHPNSTKRNGSSGQGAVCFSEDSIEKFDDYWEKIVSPFKPGNFVSYQHMYQSLVKERYPFAPDKEPLGSGGFVSRGSNLTASSFGTDTSKGRPTRGESAILGIGRATRGESTAPVLGRATRGESAATIVTTASSSRLKKSESSSEKDGSGRHRKFGGSFLKFIGGSGKNSAKEQQPTQLLIVDRPMVLNMPVINCCIDPDDSDDEKS